MIKIIILSYRCQPESKLTDLSRRTCLANRYLPSLKIALFLQNRQLLLARQGLPPANHVSECGRKS